MQTSEKGIKNIKDFEGCSLTAYPDPGTGGAPWTIGYGWTHPVDAPRDKCAHFREINGIAAAFQYLQKNYNPTASPFL